MKLSLIAILSTVGAASAFAPSASVQRSQTVMNMSSEQSSRKAFLSSAAAVCAGAFFAPAAFAGTMDQENVSDPTEVWETGSPSKTAEDARMARYTNARTQMNSNFAPQKRLTLERKSPVTRLDINAPDFGAYKKSLPGLYKTLDAAKAQ
eukprot:CAMPEP_0195534074 /NCGR_PEP_ID=MMETSP0794_2-20130614/41743_1 /TAXON_ID=515487 /ORGANISM="Stephanopyxis turris, Strain CCMP 815" /LENGTH=149 /DNA_ID=CAMNT_0040666815 /DNA_START=105 /DNA_END=554 /DNA_ORIENTATION=+